MRARLLLSAALSSHRRTVHLVAGTAAAATIGAIVPIAVGAAAASADPASNAAPALVKVDLNAPGSVTRGADASLLAKVTLASAPVPDRSVQFASRPVGDTTWTVIGSATTGLDGTTTLPVHAVDAATEYAAYYADTAGTPLQSDPATTTVHVIDVQPSAPKAVAYDAKVSVGGQLVQDGTQGVASQPVQVSFRTSPHASWSKPKWSITNASGVATVAARFARTFQVGVRFPGANGLAPSPFKVTTVQVGPRPAVSPDGFRFPLLDPSQATPPGSWTLDQGVDMFAIGQGCGAAAKLVAVGDGTVVQTGIAGFGPTAPVIRMTDGPFAGRNVYYGHTGRVYVHAGQTVKAGDLVAEIGCGRVGKSSAPHLEIGVGVPGGPPCCPGWHQTSSLIMRELVASLRGSVRSG